MKTYKVNGKLAISGETLKDAIEHDFDQICRIKRIGNAAGYQLDGVWAEYNESRQAVELHIVAHGSDMLVDYDPASDPMKEYICTIDAPADDCPVRIDFELSSGERRFDPFDDACLTSPDRIYGALIGIIDETGRRHCKIPGDDVTMTVSCKFPNASTAFPLRYAEYCRAELARRRPKSDAATARLMERISQLAAKILDHPKDRFDNGPIFKAKTAAYFQSVGRITALEKIRTSKNMTQKQLAEAAQMSARQLQNYEKCPGSTLFSASRSVPGRLAAALGVEVSDITDKAGSALLVDAD